MSGADSPRDFGWFYVSHFTARSGKIEAGTALLREAIPPVGDQLRSEGAIVSYGMHLQEIHGQHQPDRGPWTHRIWYALPDLGGIDKLNAAHAARVTPERLKQRAETFDFDAHTDDLLAVLHHEPKPKQ